MHCIVEQIGLSDRDDGAVNRSNCSTLIRREFDKTVARSLPYGMIISIKLGEHVDMKRITFQQIGPRQNTDMEPVIGVEVGVRVGGR